MKLKIIILFTLIFCSTYLTAQRRYNDTIPFRNDLGLIIIPIQFNGQEKQFAFDTGASQTLGYSWVKKELRSTGRTEKVTSSSKSVTKLRYYKSDSVNLGSVRITKHRILRAKDSDIFTCFKVDGILGMDIISHFNWTINYPEKYVVMHNSDYFPPNLKQLHPLELKYKNNRPYIYIQLKDKKIKFLMDTGATDSDISNKAYPFVIKESNNQYVEYGAFFDFNGKINKTKSSVFQLNNMKSDGVSINGIFDTGGNKSSKIGNSLWKGNTLFLSAKNNKLYSKKDTILEQRKRYGASFIYENNKMIVIKIIENSDIWKQGLRQGDEILSINGKTFTSFCDIFKYQYKLGAQDEKMTISLKNGESIAIDKQTLF
ncbi:aspartyl protease family protein [Aquimarina sp. 2201CG5-10]|uniref:aspartyl protease family protein n=1 Tax=Aquimarina callyspongiae TaxID=3098150 RepID=UPI002AB3568B|nr:aspartyl protease family protein [Aquimarina sp. 2201CG5-10]MDY8136104.1 aspartyl protease family protein [Aquimarina sp. 2201CG5-10]